MAKTPVAKLLGVVFAALIPTAALADMWPDEPGIYPNRDYVHQQFAEHIDPFSGNLQLHYVDGFAAGNGGFDLKITRSYNSLAPAESYSPFGGGWQMHFGRAYFPNQFSCTGGPISMDLPDGSHVKLYPSNGVGGTSTTTDYISLSFWRGTCDASGALAVFSPDGTKYDMGEADGSTRLTSRITDRNGNTATLTYTLITAWGRKAVSSINTNDGRTASFSYSGGLLSSVSVQGRIWSYTVTNSGGATRLTRVQPPAGSSWSYTYQSGNSLMSSMQNPQGGTTNYTYTSVNFLPGIVGAQPQSVVASKSNSLGTWSFSYSVSTSAGVYDTTTVSLPAGIGTITYRHFGLNTVNAGEVWKIGSLYQKVTGSEQTETFTWTPQAISNQSQTRPGYFKTDTMTNRALLASRTISRDGGSFSTTYSSFDSYGNPQSISESGNGSRSRSLSYFNNPSKWIIGFADDETISGAGTISRSRDTNGNLTLESRFGVNTSYGYDSSGSVSSKTDARSNSTSYNSYAFGIPRSESRPAGVSITRSTDNYGNVTSETDGESTWGFSYDGLNRVTSVNHPTGSSATISWSDTSRSLTRGSYNESTQYDAFGRATSITREGVTQTFQYDALNRKTFESLPGSSSGTTYTLDILGRVNNSSSPAGNRSYSYSSSTVNVTNERGKTTTYSYTRYGDPDEGFVVGINSPAGTAVTMSRNTVGTLLSASQDGITRTYGRDSHFFLTSLTEAETGTTTFGRDAIGNMTSKSVGGVTVGYSYDGLNRLDTITYGGSAGTVTLSYDRRSKVTQVSNPTAVRNYAYDANGNLTEDRLTIDGLTFIVGYGYDSIDGLNTITYPMSKGTVTFAPDGMGRPTRATPYLTSVSHFSSGNLSSITYGNFVTTSFSENSRQLPSSIVANNIQLSLSYSYDGGGNITSITDGYFSAESKTLGYDDADRLTSATGPWGSGSFTYSGGGNLTMQRLGSYQINYNYSSNRVSNIYGSRAMTYAYDGRGNVTGNGTDTYTMDNASQMSCANCGTANEVQYGYDGQGRRVFELKGGRKTYFVHSPKGDLQFEYTPYGKVWVKHAHLYGKRIASETDSDATATTTSLSASPSTTTFGNSVALTASVSPSSTGTVEFRENTQVLGTATLSGSQASISVGNFAVGTHSVIAVYSGDANNKTSTSTAASVVVNKAAASVSLTAAPTSGSLGQQVTLSSAVSGASPTGQVTFKEGASTLGTVTLSSGAASLVTSALAAGSHSFTASYSGDGNNQSADSTAATTSISQATPSVSLVSSNPNSTYGSSVTFTTTVSGITGFTPTGTVTFFDGAATLGSAGLSNGSAAFATSSLATGSHSITASYAGDSNYSAASSTAITQSVAAVSSSTTLAPIVTVYANQGLRISASVSGSSPTGTVHFSADGTEVGTGTLSGGATTFNIRLAVGTHSVQATYDGDTNNIGSTSGTQTATVRPGRQPQDFNLDANADLLWADSSNGSVQGWLMNGTTATLTGTIEGANTGWSVALTADFNGDGKADIVWTHTDGSTSIDIMNGLEVTGTAVIVGPGTGWSVTHAGDFDGDGKSDLVWQHTDGRVAIWLMNGTAMSASAEIIAAGSGWSVARVADMNGDGRSDLVLKHTDGRVAIWLMNGTTMITGGDILAAGSGWTVTSTADFDGDGRDDVLWTHTDGRVAIWLMNGMSMKASAEILAAGSGWSAIQAPDLNGDGMGDIVWQHTDGRVAAWLMSGLTMFSSAELLGPGTGWSVSHFADLNGDGKADLLWKQTDGSTQAWLMDGLTATSSASFTGPGTWNIVPVQP